MTVKQISKCAAFLLIGCFLFFFAQEVFTPEWGETGAKISGLEAMEDNTVDAIFLGTSLVERGFTPMRIYEDTKIRTYNLGTSAQCIQSSYYLLKHAMETQSPKVVILEPSVLFQKAVNMSFYRTVMDNLYFSRTGWEMALDYRETFDAGFSDSLFPMATYHTRWTELTESDFKLDQPQLHYAMGYGMIARAVRFDENMRTVYGKHVTAVEAAEAETYAQLSSWSTVYFEKILQLCQENGAELIIVKLPGFRSPYDNGWNSHKSQLVAQMAEEKGLDYMDLNLTGEYDLETETYDGRHMNIRGAEEISAFIGQYLTETYPELDCSGNAVYDRELEKYRSIRDVALLQSEIEFPDYLQLLSENSDRWVVAVVGYGDFVSGLGDTEFDYLQDIGLQKIRDAAATDTYAAVIADGEVAYEELSDRHITHTVSKDGWKLKLSSATRFDNVLENRTGSVTHNGVKFTAGEGLLFVVLDRETNLPIDNKHFATGTDDLTGTFGRNLLNAYEAEIIS